jgi:anti-anti-sigma factor
MSSNIHTFYPTRILSSTSASDLMGWVQDNLELGNNALLINFRDVLFMDSAGLATLITALKAVKQVGGRLALCSLNGQARMLLEMTTMSDIFEVHPNPIEFEHSLIQ